MTPHEFAAVFFRPDDSPRLDPEDRVELVARANRWAAARGRKPRVPSWFWPAVPRTPRG